MIRLNTLSPRYQLILLVVVVISLRLTLAWIFGAEVADLAQYREMADIIERGENIYQTAGLYHYTPIPMFLPAWSLQVAQTLGLPFHFVVKWPMILADVGIALLLWWQAQKRGLAHAALWFGLAYALNPVSLLTTSFHGSYSVLPALFTLLAYCLVSFLPPKRFYVLSALSLGMAIGLRGYPVLFLPFFLLKMDLDRRRKIAFLILAGLPSALTLLPFVLADFQAVWQGIFSYGGVIDYGWIASMRAGWLITTGNLYLPGSLGQELLTLSRWLFLLAYVSLTAIFWRKHERFSLLGGILGTTLLFIGLYGGISSQYLIWVVPFALLVGSRWKTAYIWSATFSLITFYLFYFPAILFGELPIVWQQLNPAVMALNLVFNTTLWVICLAWVIRLVIRPIPEIALPTRDVDPLGTVTNQSPAQTKKITSQKLILSAEAIFAVYIGWVLILSNDLLPRQAYTESPQDSPVNTQPLQEIKATTVWSVGRSGSGLGEILHPLGLAVDKKGYVYVADRGNQRVAQFSPAGEAITTWSGDSTNQTPFVEPSDIAVDPENGNIWILDSGNGWIYRLGTDGKMEAVISGAELGVYNPRGLAISPSGDIFVTDTGKGRILHLDQQGRVIATWGKPGSGPNQFRDPTGIVIQNNDLFVADANNQRIVHYTLDGKRVGEFKTGEGSYWIDSDNLRHIFVSSAHTQKVTVYDFSGAPVAELIPEENFPVIDGLAGIAIAQNGHLYAVGVAQLSQFEIEWK
jgi:DNA-binding beta-propeller fold protein YncE